MKAHDNPPAGAVMFPSSDHFPLGHAYGRVDAAPCPASSVRPFGLTLAVARSGVAFDPDQLGYDDERQIGLIRDGEHMVPLSKHTDGQTNTITDGGDGQKTNQDSDTDWRED